MLDRTNSSSGTKTYSNVLRGTMEPNQPMYVYQMPMFMVTVSAVVIVDNGVVMAPTPPDINRSHKFPGGPVRAGLETIQFACVRYVKEQTGIVLKKDALIPVDFRSDPSRSKEGNVIDIGFVCIPHNLKVEDINKESHAEWIEVDFEKKCVVNAQWSFYMDHQQLLERAIDVAMMVK